jgi:Domain of unknown function (DUF4202)
MSEDSPRLAQAVAAIDAANALDPHTIDVEGTREPAELVCGRRMSTTLGRISPQASEHLRIAVRGQHIERWTSPRKAYVEGRVGYRCDVLSRGSNEAARVIGIKKSPVESAFLALKVSHPVRL